MRETRGTKEMGREKIIWRKRRKGNRRNLMLIENGKKRKSGRLKRREI
jgi:hypothetical protein